MPAGFVRAPCHQPESELRPDFANGFDHLGSRALKTTRDVLPPLRRDTREVLHLPPTSVGVGDVLNEFADTLAHLGISPNTFQTWKPIL